MNLSAIWKGLSRFAPFVLLLLYSLLGGCAFWMLEGGGEQQSAPHKFGIKRRQFGRIQNDCTQMLLRLNNANRSALVIGEILERFADKLGLKATQSMERNFWGSVFFVGSVYTTIGYGNNAPITSMGRLFTVIYAVLGIPLVLYVLADLGKILCGAVWFCYKKCLHKRKRRIDDVPLQLAIILTVGWIAFCSWLITFWEDWDIFTSAYFFFQSLTTIGFGDITPKRPQYMMLSFVLILIGLSLVSMCWNLVEFKLEHFVEQMMRRIDQKPAIAVGTDAPDESARQTVDRMASEINNLMGNLLGQKRRQFLENRCDKKMKQRSQGFETDAIEYLCVATQTGYCPSLERTPDISDRESKAREISRSDLKAMFNDINYLLEDCQSLVSRRSQSVTATPIRRRIFPSN